MVAIGSALQIDLTGQVCSDSIGNKFYSGIGGQVDFLRGASPSKAANRLSRSHPLPERRDLSNRSHAPVLARAWRAITWIGEIRRHRIRRCLSSRQSRSPRASQGRLSQVSHPKFRRRALRILREDQSGCGGQRRGSYQRGEHGGSSAGKHSHRYEECKGLWSMRRVVSTEMRLELLPVH